MSSIHISLGTARTTPGALQTLRTESPSSGWVPTVPNSLMGTGSREIPQPWSIHRGAPRSHLKKGRRGLPCLGQPDISAGAMSPQRHLCPAAEVAISALSVLQLGNKSQKGGDWDYVFPAGSQCLGHCKGSSRV